MFEPESYSSLVPSDEIATPPIIYEAGSIIVNYELYLDAMTPEELDRLWPRITPEENPLE